MNKAWLLTVFGVSFTLMAILKTHELKSLRPFFKSDPVLKLRNFHSARQKVPAQKIELLELWESILTGRSAPLSRLTKETYQKLGLKHVFTPSGFHLSALVAPMVFFLRSRRQKLGLLVSIGGVLSFVPGFAALKRMILIKGLQLHFGLKTGFISALFLDVLFGSFQDSPLSFTYSFLFLGLIYSGAGKLTLALLFFLAQLLIAYFQGALISPLLLFWCPLLNLCFSLCLPLLFLLSFPLLDWQLQLGLGILSVVQQIIGVAVTTLALLPLFEVHLGVLLLCLLRSRRSLCLLLLLSSATLNRETTRPPALGTYEGNTGTKLLCRLDLHGGVWRHNCKKRRKRDQHHGTLYGKLPAVRLERTTSAMEERRKLILKT